MIENVDLKKPHKATGSHCFTINCTWVYKWHINCGTDAKACNAPNNSVQEQPKQTSPTTHSTNQ